MSAYRKPLPRPSATSAPFWRGLKENRLLVQRCRSCGSRQHPPLPNCAACWHEDLEWVEHPDRGVVYTYSVCHWPTSPAFKDDAPYAVAIVELQDGIRINSNIVQCDLADLRVGMPVTALYEDVTDDVTLIKFRPA